MRERAGSRATPAGPAPCLWRLARPLSGRSLSPAFVSAPASSASSCSGESIRRRRHCNRRGRCRSRAIVSIQAGKALASEMRVEAAIGCSLPASSIEQASLAAENDSRNGRGKLRAMSEQAISAINSMRTARDGFHRGRRPQAAIVACDMNASRGSSQRSITVSTSAAVTRPWAISSGAAGSAQPPDRSSGLAATPYREATFRLHLREPYGREDAVKATSAER